MNCRSVEARLSAYIDAELGGRDMLAIRDHLSQCRSCEEAHEELRALKLAMAQLSTVEPPQGFEQRLMSVVLGTETNTQPGAVTKRSPSSRLRMAFFESANLAAWRHQASLFVGVTVGAMLLTIAFINIAGRKPNAALPVAADAREIRDVTFEIQRDEVATSIADPTSGAPLLSVDARH